MRVGSNAEKCILRRGEGGLFIYHIHREAIKPKIGLEFITVKGVVGVEVVFGYFEGLWFSFSSPRIYIKRETFFSGPLLICMFWCQKSTIEKLFFSAT